MQEIKEREVFYIPGYDPRSYRYYYSLYKKHSKLQNKLNNLELKVSKSIKINSKYQWKITNNKNTSTNYTFLAWDDIVKENWPENFFSILYDVLYSCKVYLLSGLIVKYAKASSKQMIAAFYPLIYILITLVSSLFISYKVFDISSVYINRYLGITISLLLLYLFVQLILRLGKKLGVFWLSRIYAFSARWAEGKIKNIDSRIEEFSEIIFKSVKESSTSKEKEIILSAHSVGTIVCISVAFKVIEKCKKESIDYSHFKILTLGQCIPLVSFQKPSKLYRRHLEALGLEENLIWIDYTSKIDGACFPLLNFIKSSELKTQEDSGPKLLSTRFFKLFTEDNYKIIRKDWYKAHFLYLMSTDLSGDYDFFAITAGNKPLESKIK